MSDGPLRLGILGCARIAQQAVVQPAGVVENLELAGVAARDPARAEAYAQQHGVTRAYPSYQALLEDPDIGAVYNPLPNSLHGPWSARALRAGKAVLCEKPVTSNAAEARQLAGVAAETGVAMVEAFHYRYHPVAQRIGAIIASGELGPIRSVEAFFVLPDGILRAGNIRLDPGLAGGVTMDLGCYCLNILRLVTGEEPVVTSAVATLASPEIDVAMHAELEFPSGAAGRMHVSFVDESFRTGLLVTGTDGELEVQHPFQPHRGHRLELRRGGETSREVLDLTPTFVFQAREFVAVVREGAAVRTTMADGVANMEAVDAVYRAAGLRPRGT
jgi:predicted dehydrogenase